MFDRNFSVLLLVLLLSACGTIPIESKVPDELANYRAQITPGETTQQEVHERLGRPFIADERLRLELYRVAFGRDAGVHIAPFPFWVDTGRNVIEFALLSAF